MASCLRLVLNPALTEKIRKEFNVTLPEPPEEWDEATLPDYLAKIQQAVAGRHEGANGEGARLMPVEDVNDRPGPAARDGPELRVAEVHHVMVDADVVLRGLP